MTVPFPGNPFGNFESPNNYPMVLDGCPMFAPAYMGRKRRAQPLPTLLLRGQKTAAKSKNPRANGVKAFEESVFGPCTLGRTWGTRPGESNAP